MIEKRKNNQKWLWWVGGLIVLTSVLIVGVIIWQNNHNEEQNKEVGIDEVEKIEHKYGDNKKQTDFQKHDEEVAKQQQITQYEGGDPNQSAELTGVVTYAGVSEDKLTIRVTIDQYLTEGTCELTLARGGATIYNSIANIVGDVSTATCQGFDVATNELEGGNLEINIKLNAGEKSGMIRGEANI